MSTRSSAEQERPEEGTGDDDAPPSASPAMEIVDALAREGGAWARRDPSGRSPERADPLGDVYRLHRDRFWHRLQRKGVACDVAEDLVQDVFLIAHKGVAERGFVPTAKLLARILKLELGNHRRVGGRRPPHDDVDDVEVPASAPDPEQWAHRAEATRRIEALLARLPAEVAAVLRLVELEEREAGEAAAILGSPPSTVRSQHTRGLAQLAREAARLEAERKRSKIRR